MRRAGRAGDNFGSHYVMPKGRFAIKPGIVTMTFHPPIEPEDFGSRERLMKKVRRGYQ